MRRTSLTFLLFLELLGVFLFHNFNQLFLNLGNAEIDRIKEEARGYAKLSASMSSDGLQTLQALPLFSDLRPSTRPPGETLVDDSEPAQLFIRVRHENGTSYQFTVPIESKTLSLMRKIQSISTGILIISGLLLVITAIVLIVQVRKTRGHADVASTIPPLQSYLLDLKGKALLLENEVTEHRQTVEQRESLTHQILNRVQFAVVTMGRGQRIETFNLEAERLFKASYASMVNRPADEAFKAYPELIEAINTPRDKNRRFELDTQGMTLSCALVPLPHNSLLLTLEDITQVQANRKRDSERRSLHQLGDMGTFMAHEVRNALGVILGYTKTLKAEPAKIEKINEEIYFLTEMMDRFFTFSKPTPHLQFSPCQPQELVTELCRSHTSLSLEQTGDLDVTIETDPHLLRNLLDNLLRNAHQAQATRIVCHYQKGAHLLELLISDDGQGIPTEIQEKIWIPFFSTREKGSGMGLALVKKLLTTLGGDINLAESRPGLTRFRLTLPLTQT